MNFGRVGFNFLREVEGCSGTVYPDSGGADTIGIGHLLTKAERHSGKIYIRNAVGVLDSFVRYSGGLTEGQIMSLLLSDLWKVEKMLNRIVLVPLSQWEYDTLVSFAFNIGNEAFANSTLLKKLNMNRHTDVPEQLRRWNKDNGMIVQGLVNRREKEVLLWNNKWDQSYK